MVADGQLLLHENGSKANLVGFAGEQAGWQDVAGGEGGRGQSSLM